MQDDGLDKRRIADGRLIGRSGAIVKIEAELDDVLSELPQAEGMPSADDGVRTGWPAGHDGRISGAMTAEEYAAWKAENGVGPAEGDSIPTPDLAVTIYEHDDVIEITTPPLPRLLRSRRVGSWRLRGRLTYTAPTSCRSWFAERPVPSGLQAQAARSGPARRLGRQTDHDDHLAPTMTPT